jgi:hypothetical protein
MERGVVVGGLMICGSFLLAASLNRSAVEETSPAEPAAVPAPIDPPLPAVSADQSGSTACAPAASSTDQQNPANATDQGELPGNGRKACSQ